MKQLTVFTFSFCFVLFANAQLPTVSTFDQLSLGYDTFNNGADLSGGFRDGDAFFINSFDTQWAVWSGFSLSNKQDRTTPGYLNQYSTYAIGGPARATGNFMVGTGDPVIHWNGTSSISGVYVCNSTYTALSMLHGDQFAKKFGGESGDDPDYLKLTAKGYRNGEITDTTDFYLADYRNSDNSRDYILNNWEYFRLEELGVVDSVQFFLTSTDNGEFGMNTPDFFCLEDFGWGKSPERYFYIDDFEDSSLPIDSFNNGTDQRGGYKFNAYFYPNSYNTDWGSWSGWAVSSVTDTLDKTYVNQYSAKPGKGMGGSHNYMISYGNSMVYDALDTSGLYPSASSGATFTNTTYTYDQIKNGSNFSKKFGGENGTDPDYFRLIIRGYNQRGEVEGVDTFYLADYRFEDNSKDYIVDDWEYVEFECLQYGKHTVRITFELQSSDTGEFGMNTPAYFAMDNHGKIYGSISESNRRSLSVYPNPCSESIQVDVPFDQQTLWHIFDLSGLQQMEGKGVTPSIDVRSLSPGIYFIRIQNSENIYTGKFIKK